MSTLLLDIFFTEYIVNKYIIIGYIYCQQVHYYWIYLSLDVFSTSTLLLDIFITGYILNNYITIGYIYHWIYSPQVHYYWIYLSLDIFSTSTLLLNILSTITLLLDIQCWTKRLAHFAIF